MQVNISSLMDILTILLIFLILSFDSQDAKVQAPDGFDIPPSTSQAAVKLAIKVSIAPDSVRIEDEKIESLVGGKFSKSALDSDKQVKRLLVALQKEKARLEQGSSTVGDEDEKEIIYLEAATGTHFEVVDRVLKTAAAAGFSKFRLAVQRQG